MTRRGSPVHRDAKTWWLHATQHGRGLGYLPGGHLPPPKFGHLPPPNSDISHPQKKTFARRTTATPNFFLLFLAHFSWLFRLTAHGGHQGWEEGGAWWGLHGAHQVEGAWRGGHGAHQVGGGYHGGHGGRHGGGKVGWALQPLRHNWGVKTIKNLKKTFYSTLWFCILKSLQNVPKLPQITPEVPKIMNLGRTYFLYWASPNNFLHCDSAFLHQAWACVF